MMRLLKKFKWVFILAPALVLAILVIDDLELEATLLAFFYALFLIALGVRWLIREIRLINELKKEKAQMELLHLKSQVNPHFFFNTLNNLYGLVEINPNQAKELILKLSEMMRYSIYEGGNTYVNINQEVTYIKNYIELHKMRYRKHIDILFSTEIFEEETKVMPLLFILLVENAFKHGVENLREQAYVHIDLKASKTEIRFEVENNFDIEEKDRAGGIGLKNLSRRLELMYPNRHSLIMHQKNDIYKAQLILRTA